MVSARSRRFLLREKVRTTKQAGGDIRALCLSPEWLLPSAATRPIGEIVADLQEADDPQLTRLARALEQSAHLTGDAASRPQRVDTILSWLRADPRLRPVADRCDPLLGRAFMQVGWTMRPTGTARTRTLQRHRTHVVGACFSTDDRSVVTVDQNGVVLLWDVRSGAMIATLDPHRVWAEQGHDETPTEDRPRIRVQLGGEYTHVATGGANQMAALTPQGLLTVWSLVGYPEPQYALATEGDDGSSATFVFGVDDKTFMTRADDCFRLHAWRTGEVLLTMPLAGPTACSARDPGWQYFAVEASDGVVDVWDLSKRTLAGQVVLGRSELSTVAIGGPWLCTADENGAGQTWHWAEGRVVATARGIYDAPRIDAAAGTLSWLHNPGQLVVTALGTNARAAGRFVPDADDYGRATTVELPPRRLAVVMTREQSGGGDSVIIEHRVDFFDRTNGRTMASGWGEGAALLVEPAPDPDQVRVVTGYGEIETWDSIAGMTRRIRTPADSHGTSCAAVSHDRRTFAVSAYNAVKLVRPDEEGDADYRPGYRMSGSPVSAVADPAGRWFGAVTDQLVLYVCDPASGQVRHRCAGPAALEFRNALNFPAWSPDGRWIVLDDWDRSVLVWDPTTGRRLPGLGPLDANTVHVTAGANGPLVLRKHRDGRHSLWEVVSRRVVATLPAAEEIAGDAAGRWIALRDGAGVVAIWDAARGRLTPRAQGIRGMAADPSGRRLYLWDDHRVTMLTPEDGHTYLLAISDIPIAEVVVNGWPHHATLVRADGSIERLTPARQSTAARVTLPSAAAIRRSLSPDGRMLVAYHSGAIELIDLAAPDLHAAVTLDGAVRGTAWLGGSAIAVMGAFGTQALSLGTPLPPRQAYQARP